VPHISLAAEEIPLPFSMPLLGDHIPNTLPATWLTMVILISLGLAYNRAQRKEGPPSRFQVAVEAVAEGLYSFIESVERKHARLFFPLLATFFLFIAVSNWCGILPGFGSVGVWVAHHGAEERAVEHGEAIEHGEGEVAGEHEEELMLVPFFRSANAHLSTTLALAIVSVVATHYYGFKVLGASYSSRFINFKASSPKPAPPSADQKGFQALLQKSVPKFARGVETVVNGIVGLLEIILESLKVLPFSFRLFGNIFAGEVLLFVVSYLFAFVFPIIFLGLEIFVGLIQALIFTMLTLVFMSVATAHHGPEGSH
jgi:F-type H+-transporting ATPase subunit a